MLVPINIRVEKSFLKRLERFRKRSYFDRAALIREILEKGLHEKTEEFILQDYEKGELSMGEAISLLGITPWDFLDLLRRHQAYVNVDLEAFLTGAHLTS